jgi:TonB family protein
MVAVKTIEQASAALPRARGSDGAALSFTATATAPAALAAAALTAVMISAGALGCANASEPKAPIKLTPDMTPPTLTAGKVPEYTPEAIAEGVEGPVAARCVITEDGRVTNCQIVQSLPHMDKAVIDALSTWRCNPARRNGDPVAVEHIFNLKLKLPRPPNAPPPESDGIMPFSDATMTRPIMLSGRDPLYTKDALENRIQGKFIARCVITTEGAVTNCLVLKSLPYMDQAILDALMSRKYKPATMNGAPVAVRYVFNVQTFVPSSGQASR